MDVQIKQNESWTSNGVAAESEQREAGILW